jgi:GNAT superfamily N-acetyltransferase
MAHTPEGEIVGEITLAPGDEWFQGLENAYEVTIQVSSNWRGLGIAHQLLAFTLELGVLEDVIFFGMGLSWHWDTEGLGLSPHRYREMLKALFATQGFIEYQTNEPNIRMEPANIMLGRIGKRVEQSAVNHFIHQIKAVPHY